MTKEQAKEFYPILQAYAEGKTIETRRKPTTDNNGVTKDGWYEFNCWTEIKELEYWVNVEYRIKPEPTYRPFANTEECWTEMEKHQPFGWVKTKDKGIRLCIIGLNQGSAFTQVGHKYDEALDEFIFADGAPFGIKEEE